MYFNTRKPKHVVLLCNEHAVNKQLFKKKTHTEHVITQAGGHSTDCCVGTNKPASSPNCLTVQANTAADSQGFWTTLV